MRPTSILISILALIFPLSQPMADEGHKGDSDVQVVVSATRVDTPINQVASSITVISEEEIESKQEQSVSELLRSVPSTDVVRSGPRGGNTAIFLRGANSEHTLVLIDGIEANNPISNTRAFNFVDLPTDNIERIEVLRGPQSTLYGSDAMGGVVQIFTKKGEGPPSVKASSEAGSYNTYTEKASISGGEKDVYHYSSSFSREDSHGISAAGAPYGNREHDGYSNTAWSGRFGAEPTSYFKPQVFIRYTDSVSELDNGGGIGQDDLNRKVDNQQFFTRGQVDMDLVDRVLSQTYSISYSRHDYEDNNDPDEISNEFLRSEYVGWLRKLEMQNVYKPWESLSLIVGLENEEESGSSDFLSDGVFGPFEDNFSNRSATTNGYYAQASLALSERLFATSGIRVDNHSEFGSEVTWRIAPAFLLKETGTKLSATVGSGFKAPSLFQLYSSYGNPELDAEKSIGVDAGIEQNIVQNRLKGGVTYFYNKFDHLITFNPDTFFFENIADATTKGLETFLRSELCDYVSVGASYTYTDTEDNSTHLPLLRRARHKVTNDISFFPTTKSRVVFQLTYTGKRDDNDFSTFPATRTRLGGYPLFSVAASYELTHAVEFFTRVENIFDKRYEEVLGYGTYGTAAFGGVRVKFS